jgi:hypothetical protein
MKIKQKIIALAVITLSMLGAGAMAVQTASAKCGDAETSIINCDAKGGADAKDSAIWQILLLTLNILTGGVGIAAVGGIVYGAILYASASDNASQTQKAIEIIRNVVIGIVSYGIMYLVLNYLIPGGIFS